MTKQKRKHKPRKFYVVGTLALVLLLVAAVGVWIVRDHHEKSETTERSGQVQKGPIVEAQRAKVSPETKTILLTGETRPYTTFTLVAKIPGYVDEMKVDKGDEVKKNQILATISSPETTRQYEGAVADEKNKHMIKRRAVDLFRRHLISAQERDQAVSDEGVALATLKRLQALMDYETLRAPSDCTVTARFVDPGALVQAGTSPLLTLSQLDTIRVFAYVDQRDARFAQPGTPVEILMPERADFKIPAKITRIAGELDPVSRMMLAEVDLENKERQIVPGSFVNVSMNIKAESYIEVPIQAVVQRNDDLFVPVISKTGQVEYRKIVVADNDGMTVKVASGLKEGELVALNIGESVQPGGHVRYAEAKPKKSEDQKENADNKKNESSGKAE